MPCSGPSKPTEKQVDAVYEDVKKYIQEKHNILNCEECLFPHWRDSRAEAFMKLRAAVEELLTLEIYESW